MIMVNLRNCEISVRKKVKILVEGDKMDLDQDIFSKDNAYFFHDNIFFFFPPPPNKRAQFVIHVSENSSIFNEFRRKFFKIVETGWGREEGCTSK